MCVENLAGHTDRSRARGRPQRLARSNPKEIPPHITVGVRDSVVGVRPACVVGSLIHHLFGERCISVEFFYNFPTMMMSDGGGGGEEVDPNVESLRLCVEQGWTIHTEPNGFRLGDGKLLPKVGETADSCRVCLKLLLVPAAYMYSSCGHTCVSAIAASSTPRRTFYSLGRCVYGASIVHDSGKRSW